MAMAGGRKLTAPPRTVLLRVRVGHDIARRSVREDYYSDPIDLRFLQNFASFLKTESRNCTICELNSSMCGPICPYCGHIFYVPLHIYESGVIPHCPYCGIAGVI